MRVAGGGAGGVKGFTSDGGCREGDLGPLDRGGGGASDLDTGMQGYRDAGMQGYRDTGLRPVA
jgi:hypothetical protein